MAHDAQTVQWQTPPEWWEKLKPLARQKRHAPTPAERRLWQSLRGRKLARFKFRRQFPIERFMVDFACLKPRLVIEVDGPVHDYAGGQDAIRQEYIESLGFHVLRFTNEDVFSNLDGVLLHIHTTLTQLAPPLRVGEGDGG